MEDKEDKARKDKVREIRVQYEKLAVEEAQLRVGLAQIDGKRAELRIQMAELSD